MFLNAVVLVLQEILEAALLISVLLVFTQLLRRSLNGVFQLKMSWVAYAVLFGVLGAWVYASNMSAVSEWFEYVGQEVVNASLQIIIVLCLITFSWAVSLMQSKEKKHYSLIARLCMISMVALAITREGSEIIVYITGVGLQSENSNPVLFGGMIGGGIGISAAVILYYLLILMSSTWAFRVSLILLALVAGNMSAQAVLHLTQADWLPFTPIIWNSMGFLSEDSITGQLLYALVGYEATPSALQAVCYFAGALVLLFSPLFRMAWPKSKSLSLEGL